MHGLVSAAIPSSVALAETRDASGGFTTQGYSQVQGLCLGWITFSSILVRVIMDIFQVSSEVDVFIGSSDQVHQPEHLGGHLY